MENDVECPKCGLSVVRVTNATHPRAYECAGCGHCFVRGRNMLLDE
jgi:predicted RNA-binding Zn-ribbon protein involved in translation (DUF1610 family)